MNGTKVSPIARTLRRAFERVLRARRIPCITMVCGLVDFRSGIEFAVFSR